MKMPMTPKNASAPVAGSQAAKPAQVADLRAFEAEFEQALRIIEERAELRSKEFEEERQRLAGEAEAEAMRSEMVRAELAAERRKTMAVQANLSAAESRLVALEQTLDAVEDEVEETIQKVELRVAQDLAAMQRQLREEIRRRVAAEAKLGTGSGRLAAFFGKAAGQPGRS